ncbi:GIY-YIG nuclease family protein [Ottowia thiooxydans]|uniref:GIY-YIG superfamily endonuclease n=1 Tax=Ottowia thiooxydans TaxID=219182 RepID=A0ABV2Q280_9BURK
MRYFYVYILRCGDGSYYIGHTDDVVERMRQHESSPVGYTSSRKPIELVWQGEFETREGALAFEQRIKGWSRAKKEALIEGDWKRVRQLARSRNEVTSAPRLRQAQPEREGGNSGPNVGGRFRAALSTESSGSRSQSRVATSPPVRSELVEGRAKPKLVHPTSPSHPVRPEPVEGSAELKLAHPLPHSLPVRPELVKGRAKPKSPNASIRASAEHQADVFQPEVICD